MADTARQSKARGLRNPFPWFEGWNVLVALMLLQGFTIGLYGYCFAFWVSPWMATFEVSRGQVMLALMAGNLCQALISPLVGKALDRFSAHRLVMVGVVAYGASLLLVAVAGSMPQIIAIYATILSLGLVLTGPLAAQTLIMRWFTRKRGLALGLVAIGTSIGGFFLPPLVTRMQDAMGWEMTHMMLAAATVLLVLPMAALFIRGPDHKSTPLSSEVTAATEQAQDRVGKPPAPHPEWTVATVLRSRDFLPLIISLMPLILTGAVISSNLALFALDLGIAPREAAFVMSAIAVTGALGKVVVGYLCDLLDHRTVHTLVSLCLAATLFIALSGPSFSGLMFLSVTLGFSTGSFLALMPAIVSRQFGPRAFGLVAGMCYFSFSWTSVSVPLAAWVRDTTGSYDLVWITLLGLTALCYPLILRVKPRKA